jgi:hypothetical protein
MNLREMLIAGRLDIAEAIFDDRRRRRQLLEILDRPLGNAARIALLRREIE